MSTYPGGTVVGVRDFLEAVRQELRDQTKHKINMFGLWDLVVKNRNKTGAFVEQALAAAGFGNGPFNPAESDIKLSRALASVTVLKALLSVPGIGVTPAAATELTKELDPTSGDDPVPGKFKELATEVINRILLSRYIAEPGVVDRVDSVSADFTGAIGSAIKAGNYATLNEFTPFLSADKRRFSGGATVDHSDVAHRFDISGTVSGGGTPFGFNGTAAFDISPGSADLAAAARAVVSDGKAAINYSRMSTGRGNRDAFDACALAIRYATNSARYVFDYAKYRPAPQAMVDVNYAKYERAGSLIGLGGYGSVPFRLPEEQAVSLFGAAHRVWAHQPGTSTIGSYRSIIGLVYQDRLSPNREDLANAILHAKGLKEVEDYLQAYHWSTKVAYAYSPKEAVYHEDLHTVTVQYRDRRIHAPIYSIFFGTTGSGTGFGGAAVTIAF